MVFKSIWRHVCWTCLPLARGIHLDEYHRAAGGTRERGLPGALARDIPFSPVQRALESTRDGGGAGGAGMIGASVAVAVGRTTS